MVQVLQNGTVMVLQNGTVIEHNVKINGRRVERGTEISITGERGRFRFAGRVTTATGNTWINAFGRYGSRSFDEARVKTVHRKRKGRP